MSRFAESPEKENVDEQLTAYLDGELSASDATALEKRLVDEESLRLRLAELRKAYELLDELPETPYNQRFTQSTLEHVVEDFRKSESLPKTTPLEGRGPSHQAKKSNLSWNFGIALISSIAIGAVAGGLWQFMQHSRQVQDLNLVANVTGLLDVDELTVAKELSKEQTAIKYLQDYYSDYFIPPAPKSISDRITWISSLTPVQQAKLSYNRELLAKLDSSTYRRIDAIEKQIESSESQEALHETIRVVGLVMDSNQNSERLALDGMKQSTRMRVDYLKGKLNYKAATHYFLNRLPQSDQDAVKSWGEDTLEPALVAVSRTSGRNLSELINRFMFIFRTIDGKAEELMTPLVNELLPDLSSDGRTLLSNLRLEEQLSVLFDCLDPQANSYETLLEQYSNLPSKSKELIDLSNPSDTKSQINREVLRRRFSRPRN
ncbi:MAG: hypothetical protein KGQ60_13615 [Planctomycetes bacterium]|nr:hypothetical protein [Planctomycetota bacterium]